MATVPSVYDNNTPLVGASLSPLQLALANYMAAGNPLAFAPNERFLQAMKNYCDSFVLSPLDFDPRTGFPRVPDISRDITGLFYLVNGDNVYIYRRAPDCGPGENRYEWTKIGNKTEVAVGTWAFYGPIIRSGKVADATFYADGGYGPSADGSVASVADSIGGQGEGAAPGAAPGTVASDQSSSD